VSVTRLNLFIQYHSYYIWWRKRRK